MSNDYVAFISDGEEKNASYARDIVELETHDQVIQSDGCTCTNKEHVSDCEIEHVVVDVQKTKRSTVLYVVEMAFCKKCGAYYIPQKSYEHLAEKGNIVHPIKGGIQLFKYLDHGDAYDEEKKQLSKIEKELNKEYENLPKPISRYAIDDNCGGLHDIQGQKYSAEKIYQMQDAISALMKQPYIGRIDLSKDGSNRTAYYIGGTEDKKVGGLFVHSRWSDIGRLFGRHSETKGNIGGNVRQVDLRRNIFIESEKLRGIEDIFSSNTEYAKKGIYDKFLIQVLMTRKKSHQLTDIIATIQDKQNEIIETAAAANIIVQGCAGSGKTMVMLHRLSYWLYNNKTLKPEKIKILTPNDNFNLHISDLHTQLNLGSIDIMSIDKYYAMLLRRYGNFISSYEQINEEEDVDERFLNYVYSKAFIKSFTGFYNAEISNYALPSEIDFINDCTAKVKIKSYLNNKSVPGETIVDLGRVSNDINDKILAILSKKKRLHEKISNAQENLDKSSLQMQQLSAEKYNYETEYKEVIANSVNEMIQLCSDEVQNLTEQRSNLLQDIASMNKGLLRFRNASKKKTAEENLANFDNQIAEAEKVMANLQDINNQVALSETIEEIKSLIGTNNILKDIMSISDYLTKYANIKKQLKIQQATADRAAAELDENKQKLNAIITPLSAEEIKRISDLTQKYPRNVELVLFNRIFNKSVAEQLFELEMERPAKTYRYELYARLFFAELFWKKTVGDDHLICIDEGQDVSYYEYERIIAQNGSNTKYNIYGDLNQRIKHGRGLVTWEQLRKKLIAHEFTLNENYRNTNQITQYCNDVFNYDMTLTGVEGEPVRNILFDEMLDELCSLSPASERTAVIIPRSFSKQRISRAKKVNTIKDLISAKYDTSKISVMYVDEIKGIEFDRVYVVDQDMDKNESYIAYTRALDNLTIVH